MRAFKIFPTGIQETPINRDQAADYANEGWSIAEDSCDQPTWAVDLCNVDVPVSGTDWTPLASTRILWVTLGQPLEAGANFDIVVRGVYNLGGEIRFQDLVNIDSIELAIFRVVEGQPDDYWFVLGERAPIPGTDFLQFSFGDQFDFRVGERYYLAFRLKGAGPSATLIGSDDYSAWGASWAAPLAPG